MPTYPDGNGIRVIVVPLEREARNFLTVVKVSMGHKHFLRKRLRGALKLLFLRWGIELKLGLKLGIPRRETLKQSTATLWPNARVKGVFVHGGTPRLLRFWKRSRVWKGSKFRVIDSAVTLLNLIPSEGKTVKTCKQQNYYMAGIKNMKIKQAVKESIATTRVNYKSPKMRNKINRDHGLA